MTYFIPDSRFEIPELLTPRQKPSSRVKVNHLHPLTIGLGQYFCPKPNQTEELITGRLPTTMTGAWEGSKDGIGWRTSADGHYIEYPHDKRQDINGDFTLWWRGWIFGEVAGVMGFMGVRAGAISNGEWNFRSNGDASNDEVVIQMRDNGTTTTVTPMGTSSWPAVHPEMYSIWVTMTGAGNFEGWQFVDGKLDVNGTATGSAGTYPFTAAQIPLYLCELNDAFVSAIDARFLCGGIWHRALQEHEIFDLERNPYQFLMPE